MKHILRKTEGVVNWHIEYWDDETDTISLVLLKKYVPFYKRKP